MPEVFAASGYRTGIFGKWHLGDNHPYRPEDRGFQEAVWYPSSHIGSVPDAWNNDYFNDRYRHNGKVEQYQGYSGDVFFDQAMSWMRSGEAGRPFFAYIPLNVAHGPLLVPAQFRKPYEHLPERFARYYGMVANIDYNVGRLEAMLRQTGLRDNTILIFLTDNGNTKATSANPLGCAATRSISTRAGIACRASCAGRRAAWAADAIAPNWPKCRTCCPRWRNWCGLARPAGAAFDGVSLAALAQGKAKALADRTLVVQFSRMDSPRPEEGRRRGDVEALAPGPRQRVVRPSPADPGSRTTSSRNGATWRPGCGSTMTRGGPKWSRRSTTSCRSTSARTKRTRRC